jgi:hypothetical protein
LVILNAWQCKASAVMRNFKTGQQTMKYIIITLLFLCNSALGQTNSNIVITKKDTLFSQKLNENRELFIYVPQLENEYIQSATYPVLYLLDGDKLFIQTIGILNHLSNEYGSERCPKMIIVGIVNNNRIKDLLPVTNNDIFSQFLEEELIPYIDKKYPTQPYRTFLGHSLGGLRVTNTLVYQSQIFNSYIALDPSLGHDLNVWSDKAHKTIPNKIFSNKSLYLAMAQTMPKNMDTATISKDTTGASRHMRAIMQFENDINNKKNELNFAWKYYPDKTHSEVTFNGTYDGLQSIFSWFYNPDLYKIFDPNVGSIEAAQIITKRFEIISAQMGYNVLPPEENILKIIEHLMTKGQKEKAIFFAKLNIKNYPKSELAIYHLSEIEKQ